MSDDLHQPINPDATIIAHGMWHGTIDPRHPPHWVDYLWTWRIEPPCGFTPDVITDSNLPAIPPNVVRS